MPPWWLCARERALSDPGGEQMGPGDQRTNRRQAAANKEIFEEQLRKVLKYLAYAPVVFISAAEGKNIHTVLKLVKEVAAERRKRVSTGQRTVFSRKSTSSEPQCRRPTRCGSFT